MEGEERAATRDAGTKGACARIAAARKSGSIQGGVAYMCVGEAFRNNNLYLDSAEVLKACGGQQALARFHSLSHASQRHGGGAQSNVDASYTNELCAGAAFQAACGHRPVASDPVGCFCALNTFCAEQANARAFAARPVV
jgi:hypothetical protein